MLTRTVRLIVVPSCSATMYTRAVNRERLSSEYARVLSLKLTAHITAGLIVLLLLPTCHLLPVNARTSTATWQTGGMSGHLIFVVRSRIVVLVGAVDTAAFVLIVANLAGGRGAGGATCVVGGAVASGG